MAKYVGENSLTKLLTLIKGVTDTKITNPTGGSTGQILTKTASGEAWADAPSGLPEATVADAGKVLQVDSTGEWGKGEAEEVTLVDIPTIPQTNSLLKGDGSGGVSAATAGTDYQASITVSGILKGNGSGGISAAVAGTDYAPAGYGLGTVDGQIALNQDANNALRAGWYACTINTPTTEWWNIFVAAGVVTDSYPNGYCCTQFAFPRFETESYYGVCYLKRSKASNGNWSHWEWVNPPMQVGVEYRTTERRNGNPVYKKIDSNGIIYWSTDQSTWNAEAPAYQYSTTDLTAGTSPLATGTLYFVYE